MSARKPRPPWYDEHPGMRDRGMKIANNLGSDVPSFIADTAVAVYIERFWFIMNPGARAQIRRALRGGKGGRSGGP